MDKLRKCIFFFLIAFFVLNGFAQEQSTLKKFLTVEEGLSQNSVTGILKDSKGFMWLATSGGLNRYDGYEFVQYKSRVDKENYLSNPSLECIYEDTDGNFWIGTQSGGLNFYDYSKEQFSQITHFGKNNQTITDNRIISINQSQDGSILVGTWSDGLFILDVNNDTLLHPIVNKRIYKILVENKNTIWLGTEQGLIKYDLYTNKFDQIDFGDGVEITDITFTQNANELWLVGWKCGLKKFHKKNYSWINYDLKKDDNSGNDFNNDTYSLLHDSKNKLWVGTWGEGIYNFDKENSIFIKKEIGPKHLRTYDTNYDIILDIYEDSDNNIWLGLDGGGAVFIGEKKAVNGISIENDMNCGLKNFHILGIHETDDGSLWVGTRGGLYKSTDKKTFEMIPSQVSTREALIINYIYQYNDSLLWIGTADRLLQLDISKKQLELTPLRNELIRNIKKVTSVFSMNDVLILGTQQDGIYIICDDKNGQQERKHVTPGNNEVLKSNRITFIKKGIDNKIWIGTFNGLYLFDMKTQSLTNPVFSEGEVLTSDILLCWEQTSDSVIWLGTPNGLNKLVKKDSEYSISHFYQESELPDDYIHAILSDNQNHIWFSTNYGIVRMNVTNNEITTFDKSDGLQGMSFSSNKGFKSSNGTLYFGGLNGFNYFDPRNIEINRKTPPVVFTKLKIYNQEVKTLQKVNGDVILEKSINSKPAVQLSYKQNQFTIEFAALNFISSNRNKYKYKLQGYDSEWISLGNTRTVTFRNLRAGDYVFKVKSANNYNVWNENAAELAITVKPPFWKTWYALAFYVLLVVGIVLIIRWNAVKQVQLSKNLELERMQHAQDQRISEMKFQFFTNISHEFRTPLTLILAPMKEILGSDSTKELPEHVQHKLQVMQRNVKRLMTLVNQLLDFRKAESGTMKLSARYSDVESFVEEVCFPFEELAKINEIDFKIYSRLKTKFIWFDREKLEVILNNLVSNAFKFVKEKGKIRISLFEEEEEILISVRNNGPGINPADLKHIFDRFYNVEKGRNYSSSGIGLALVKRLVEMHRGNVSVTSEPNENTEFEVALPKGKAHLNLDEIAENQEVENETKFINEEFSLSSAIASKFKKKLISGAIILVVEDKQEMQDYIQSLLSPHYRVETAINGADGFEKALEVKPDLIISDVMMPQMDGFEFCKKIKVHQDLATTPFILLTAKSAAQYKLMGAQHGADVYISKPFDPHFLLQNVNNLLARQEKLQKQYSKTVRLEPSDIEITPVEEVFVKNVISIVEKNLQNPDFSSETLASKLNMSGSSLYRKLKSATGSSTAELIRTIRIKRAAQLLADKQRTITEIAYDVGFNDLKHFRTVFQKHFGCSPSEYREKL
jgi:signal transduction histidine kinase/ligand-binding sensor domain-containing protein/DNA-binding response OmpR family regulator